MSLKNFLIICTKSVSLVLVLIIGTSLAGSIQMNFSAKSTSRAESDKMLWTLYVGSNVDSNGLWSQEDEINFRVSAKGLSGEELTEYKRSLLLQRYKDLFSEPANVFKLIKGKFTTLWAIFSYPVGLSNEMISKPQVASFYNRFLFKPLTCIEYIITVVITLVGICLTIKNRKREKLDLYLFFELYILGVTAMLMLTECNNKYSISMQQIFILSCLLLPNRKEIKS